MEQIYTVGTAVSPSRRSNAQGKGVTRPVEGRVAHLPLTVEATRMMKSARSQLRLAEQSVDEFERYSYAHLAALRVAGAVVEAATGGAKSRRVETIWQKLSRVRPELAMWAVVFEESAHLRALAEAGDLTLLRQSGADFWLGQARLFVEQAQQLFASTSSLLVPQSAA